MNYNPLMFSVVRDGRFLGLQLPDRLVVVTDAMGNVLSPDLDAAIKTSDWQEVTSVLNASYNTA